jgi:acetate kinase
VHAVDSIEEISGPESRVRVAVEPTNEEWVMASHALVLMRVV